MTICKRDGNDVEKIAQDCFKKSKEKGANVFRYTDHARDRMVERNIDSKELEEIINYGSFVDGAERFHEDENDYTYVIRNKNVDDRDLAICLGIKTNKDGEYVVVVTVMCIDPQSGKFYD